MALACVVQLATVMEKTTRWAWWPGASCLMGLVLAAGVLWALPSFSSERSQALSAGTANAVKAPGEAKVGDKTTCPVHPDYALTASDNTPKASYHGRVYYFCCAHCVKKFTDHPENYVK